MSSLYDIIKNGVTTSVNVRNIQTIDDNSIIMSGVTLDGLSSTDIDGIKTVAEEYSGGGSTDTYWHSDNPLCFTAEQAGSTVATTENAFVNPQISYNGKTWEEYTNGTTITLTNVGDKVYFRSSLRYIENKSLRHTCFNMQGKIAASGNPESLIEGNKGTLYSSCYAIMFLNCYALTTAPELPATTLASNCYDSMFFGCNKLTTAPELPATTLTSSCYYRMFYNCKSLTTAPELPATTLAESCYQQMFLGCTSLTTAPELPATTLASECYMGMFEYCTFTTAPELPATTLASNCYDGMFADCTSLTTAPELPATTLTEGCYDYMFQGCKNLNYIKVGATSWNTSYTTGWVYYVSKTGTFVITNDWLEEGTGTGQIPTSISGIPSGWTVERDAAELDNLLCFTAEEAGSTIAKATNPAYVTKYSTDGTTWTTYASDTTLTLDNVGDKVYFRATGNSTSSTAYKFTMTGKIAGSGNIQYLIDPYGKSLDAPKYCYYQLFNGCASLTTAPELPATTLGDYCYYDLFNGCTSLTTAPELPATELASSCYSSMFYNCKNLNYIKVGATSWGGASEWYSPYASLWVSGVSSTGTFVKPADTDIPTSSGSWGGTGGIPYGWTVESA